MNPFWLTPIQHNPRKQVDPEPETITVEAEREKLFGFERWMKWKQMLKADEFDGGLGI